MGGCSSTTSASPSFSFIPNQYESFAELTEALRGAGLESSNLIVGIDYTKSNQWSGNKTFSGRCLHEISDEPNQYQQSISLLAQTLEPFDDDNLIPAFGFGDIGTRDHGIFSMRNSGEPCEGFQQLLEQYALVTPSVALSGPTNFAPLIYEAINIVKRER